jgi:hypothetical protein
MKFLQDMPKEKQQRVILVGIGTLIGCALLFQFYVRKQIADIRTSAQQAAMLMPQIEEAQNAQQEVARNKESREELKMAVADQLAAMVSGDPFAWVVREISLLAENHPVRVMSLRPGSLGQHTRNGRYKIYSTGLELEGTYDQLGSFLEALENKFSTSEIRSVQIVPIGAKQGDLRMSLALSLLARPETESDKPAGGDAASTGKGVS